MYQDAKAEDVRLDDSLPTSARIWRHVSRRGRCRRSLATEQRRHPEVGQIGVPILVEQDVVGCHVAMHYAAAVRMPESRANGGHQIQHRLV